MNLLVFSSGSRVSQGLIRQLYSSGQFQNIVCADLYPNYWGIKSHTKFLQELDDVKSQTKITDKKITERSDLHNAISQSSHLLYVTHDYYKNCSSKVNLLKQTSKIAKELNHLKKFVTVLPVELDNWAEPNPNQVSLSSAEEAAQIYDKQIILRTDFLYGTYSVLENLFLSRLINGQSLNWSPRGASPSPFSSDDLAKVTQLLFQNDKQGGKYVCQGDEKVEWREWEKFFNKVSPNKFFLNPLEKLVSPLSKNMISELIYYRDYQNAVQAINNYNPLAGQGYQNVKELGVELTNFKKYSESFKPDFEKYANKRSFIEQFVCNRLY